MPTRKTRHVAVRFDDAFQAAFDKAEQRSSSMAKCLCRLRQRLRLFSFSLDFSFHSSSLRTIQQNFFDIHAAGVQVKRAARSEFPQFVHHRLFLVLAESRFDEHPSYESVARPKVSD